MSGFFLPNSKVMWLTGAVGHYFDRVEEQDAMLALLEQTQKDHARPTESVSIELLQAWGRHIGMPRSFGRMSHVSNGNA
jgi:hypothetical protein